MSAFGESSVGRLDNHQALPAAGDAHNNGPLTLDSSPDDHKRRMTQPEALTWIAELFDAEPGDLAPETPRAEILAWDSLGVLTLMASLDSDFGIVLEDGDIAGLKKVEDILELLRRNGRLA